MTNHFDPLPDFDAINRAYWRWRDANCPFDRYAEAEQERQWREQNRFPYEGRLWHRVSDREDRTLTFRGADGVVVARGDTPTAG
jgi:hypothetical protein